MNSVTYDKESIYIGPDEKRYIRINLLEKLLETKDYCIRLLEIPSIKLKDNSKVYDLDYIEKLIKECRNFFNLHYTRKELISLTSSSIVSKGVFDKYKVIVPIDFQRILHKSIHNSTVGAKVAYKKSEVDTLLKEISPYKNNPLILYESDTYIIVENNKKYVNTDTAISILDSTKWCFSQMDIPYITFKNQKFFDVQHIENLIKEYKIFFDKYYTRKEANKLASTHFSYITPNIEIPIDFQRILLNYKEDSVGQVAYLKTDVENYLRKKDIKPRIDYKVCDNYFLDENGRKYVSYETAMNLLEVKRSYLKTSDIPFIYGSNNVKLFDLEYIENLIKDCKSFFENHYKRSEAYNLTTKRMVEQTLPKVYIPKIYLGILKSSLHNNCSIGRVAYLKSDVIDAQKKINPSLLCKNSKKDLIDKGIYIPLSSCLEILNIPIPTLRTFFKQSSEYYLCTFLFQGTKYIKTKDVNKIKKLQQDFLNDYISTETAKNVLLKDFSRKTIIEGLNRYPAPIYIPCKDNLYGRSTFFYKLSEIEEFISTNKRRYIIDNNIFGTSNYDTFLLRLESCNLWNNFNDNTKYTKNIWYEYCQKHLSRTMSKGRKLQELISYLIKLTVELKQILDIHEVNEIYLLSCSKINFSLNTLPLAHKEILFSFLQYVYWNLAKSDNKNIKCKFRIKDINNPNFVTEEELNEIRQEKTIYDFEVYSEIFNYCTDLDKHIRLSLEEIRSYNTCTYASSWLYVMLHLNNAWRHGDVRDFPLMINIFDLVEQLQIYDFDWFDNNKIEIKIARAVIERIRQWEIIISKTQMKGVFFCSDELAPSISSAIILLTLFHKKYSIVGFNNLMIFNTDYNDITKSQLKKFFNDINIKNFTFYSRRFNRTIMSYVYYIANLSGDPKSALYAKIMRSHVNLNSTTHYLDFNGINSLSKQLFQRGEFGFVATLLAYKLNNNEIGTFEEVTKQACELNKVFGSVQAINTNVGFLNTIYGEYKQVVEYLESKSFEDCQQLMSDLYARKLTSMEGCDCPCLLGSNNCRFPEKYESCFECTFHIPTIYTLSTLCEYLREDIDLFYKTDNLPKKFQISKRFAAKRKSFIQAIQILGEDYVYGCLGMPKDNFIEEVITFNINSRRLLQRG